MSSHALGIASRTQIEISRATDHEEYPLWKADGRGLFWTILRGSILLQERRGRGISNPACRYLCTILYRFAHGKGIYHRVERRGEHLKPRCQQEVQSTQFWTQSQVPYTMEFRRKFWSFFREECMLKNRNRSTLPRFLFHQVRYFPILYPDV